VCFSTPVVEFLPDLGRFVHPLGDSLRLNVVSPDGECHAEMSVGRGRQLP
jgi:hypothetical protein